MITLRGAEVSAKLKVQVEELLKNAGTDSTTCHRQGG